MNSPATFKSALRNEPRMRLRHYLVRPDQGMSQSFSREIFAGPQTRRSLLTAPGSPHELLLLQPKQAIARPGMNLGKRRFVSQPDSVPALLIDMQIERHAGFSQRGGEGERILHGHSVVLAGVPEETRRRFLRHL